MRPFNLPPIIRIRVPEAGGEEPRSHKRHRHTPSAVAAVRKLVEGTGLPYHIIAKRTGVGMGTISRWTERHGWQRPPTACASTRQPGRRADPVPSGRALAKRARLAAERLLAEIDNAPAVDREALREAVGLLKEARRLEGLPLADRRAMMPPKPPPPPRVKRSKPPTDEDLLWGEGKRRKRPGLSARALSHVDAGEGIGKNRPGALPGSGPFRGPSGSPGSAGRT